MTDETTHDPRREVINALGVALQNYLNMGFADMHAAGQTAGDEAKAAVAAGQGCFRIICRVGDMPIQLMVQYLPNAPGTLPVNLVKYPFVEHDLH